MAILAFYGTVNLKVLKCSSLAASDMSSYALGCTAFFGPEHSSKNNSFISTSGGRCSQYVIQLTAQDGVRRNRLSLEFIIRHQMDHDPVSITTPVSYFNLNLESKL